MMEKDVICGMLVATSSTQIKELYQGKTYYFCSELCRSLFLREPERYMASMDTE